MYLKLFLFTIVFALLHLASAKHINNDVEYVKKTNVSVKSHKSTLYCYYNSDCQRIAGPNSRCYYSQCICDLGYRSVNAYCTKQICTWDSDCTRYFYNTRCSFNRCVCASGTHLDYYSQTCLYNSGFNGGLFIGLPVGLVIFVAILVCCCCCCRRRRRQVRGVILTPGSAPLPPPGPLTQPIPPAYQGSYQNNGYQNQAYQNQPAQMYPSLNQAPPPYNPAYTQPPQTGYQTNKS